MIAKNTSRLVGNAEGGQRPARDEKLFADLDDPRASSDWNPDPPCCPLPWPPGCRCSWRDRHVPAMRERGAVVGCRRRSSQPARPPGLGVLDELSFVSGVAWPRKSFEHPASAAMAAAVSGLSPVIQTVLMPMRRSSGETLLACRPSRCLSDAPRPEPGAVGHDQRRPARLGNGFDDRFHFRGVGSAFFLDVGFNAPSGALRMRATVLQIDAAHARLRRKGMKVAPSSCSCVRGCLYSL